MTKFIVMIAVATFVVFQGFAQKVDPLLPHKDGKNKTTAQVVEYLMTGRAPQGYPSGVSWDELRPKVIELVNKAVPGKPWDQVLYESKCINPNSIMAAKQYRLWGHVGGKMSPMGEDRELRPGEQLLVHQETGKVLAGCQCANPVIEPVDWENEPPVVTADNSAPVPFTEIDTRPQPAPVPRTNQQVPQNDQGSSSSSTSSSTSRSSSDCYGDDCDGIRKKIVRSHYDEVEQYLSVRDRDLARMNDEYLRVKQGESYIRLVEKSRCCDDNNSSSSSEYSHHDSGPGVVYVQSGGGGTACGCNPGYCSHGGGGGVTNVNAGLSLNFGGGMPQVYPQHYRPYGQGQVVPMYQPAPIVTGGGQVLRPRRGSNTP